jgi:hypothetical protein
MNLASYKEKKLKNLEYIVTCRHISRQRPKYEHATIERVLEEVFSTWSTTCPVLGNGPIGTHSDNRRGVSYVVRSMPNAGNGPINMQSDT